ncbi:MAG TPA: ribonucleotide reductase N-terminal alpha domain-containing protein, partial [Stenomitos sp.]
MPSEFDLEPLAGNLLKRRYLRRDRFGNVSESPSGLLRRVAKAIAQPDEQPELAESRFYELMASREFLPNSPTLMNAGQPEGLLSGCFVLPLDDSLHGIFETRGLMAPILAAGGGVGLSFGRLHAAEDTAAGFAGGPVRWLEGFASDLEVLARGGRRRGAAMGMLPVWHADIL